MKRVTLRAALTACLFALASAGAGSAQAAAPCGTLTGSQVSYTHVIWILEENHSYGDIVGNTAEAPYINSLISACGLATNYHNISHPSLPNYVGMTSGLPLSGLSQFTNDCSPSRKCSTTSPSIFSQTPSWKAYEESMPSNCDKKNSGEYAVRHNPPPYFSTLTGCATNDVPYTQLSTDLNSNSLRSFSFITPNLIDDMHDGTILQGDQWLQANLPAILNSSEYTAGNVAVFITWDEGEGGTSNDCATNTTDIGCHVATIAISPSTTPGTQDGTLFNHYSLLGTAEQLLGLPPLQEAASFPTMVSAFGL
jgi:acid phosphatase